jgi:hypothetical protein
MRRKMAFELVFIFGMLFLFGLSAISLCVFHDQTQREMVPGRIGEWDVFMDGFVTVYFPADPTPYLGEPKCLRIYPPLGYLLLQPIASVLKAVFLSGAARARSDQIGIMTFTIMLAFFHLCLGCLIYECKTGNKLIRFLTVGAFFVSCAAWGAVVRANVIYISVLTSALFLIGYKHRDPLYRELAYLALTVAAGMKIYPAVFGILLLYERRWWAAFRLAAYGAAVFFLPFYGFEGGWKNFHWWLENLFVYQTTFISEVGWQYRYGCIPLGMFFSNGASWNFELGILDKILGFLCMATAWSFPKRWQIVLSLTCGMIIAMPHSAQYCILYLFYPLVLFLNDEEHVSGDWFYLFCVLAVLNPYQIHSFGRELLSLCEGLPHVHTISGLLSSAAFVVICLGLCGEGIWRASQRLKRGEKPFTIVSATESN